MAESVVERPVEHGGVAEGAVLPAEPSPLDGVWEERERRLAELAAVATSSCGGSKLVVGELSPGCRHCAAGGWSCLFVSGLCNARCFFCPAEQIAAGEPQSQGLFFPDPEDWVDFITLAGCTGASLSGGEPLLDLERSLRFASTLKRRLGDRVHLWLYTNGLLATTDAMARLADAGVDEVRFNLAAVGYRLDGPRAASGRIPTVTVEVPAIPEDEARLAALLEALADAGVRHLNLHQLRATDFNRAQLLRRGYTLLDGPDPTVLESELSALALLAAAAARPGAPSVHYCSYVYRERYQAAATRRRAARLFVADHEAITATGHIRRLSRCGELAELARLAEELAGAGHDERLWQLEPARQRLHLHPSLWAAAGGAGVAWAVRYERAMVLPTLSYRNRFRQIPLNDRRSLVVERCPALAERILTPPELDLVDGLLRGAEPAAPSPSELAALELMPQGLQRRP